MQDSTPTAHPKASELAFAEGRQTPEAHATHSGPRVYRILILMSDTGGGHRASAQALASAFQERYGDRFQIDIVDLWTDHTPWPMNQLPKSYGPIINQGVWFWKFMWRVSERATVSTLVLRLAGLFARRSMKKAFARYNPDMVISVHPLMQEIPHYVLSKMGRQVPFVTVVTDLATINPLWFYEKIDRCFVASEEARQRALRAGLQPDQLRLYGLPVRPAFAQPPAANDELKKRLGLDPERLTVLLMSGGEGMGPVAAIAIETAQRLAADHRQAQMVVICGRNQKLQRSLSNQEWPIPVQIQGFVTNMPEWMAASDCIVTKAGPGTIAEALICGVPILLSSYIPGQEEGNVPFVVGNGVGAYSERPRQIAEIVSRWFGPENTTRRHMSERARSLGKPQSTYQIVDEIAQMVISAGN